MSALEHGDLMPWQKGELRESRGRRVRLTVVADDAPATAVATLTRDDLTVEQQHRFDRMLAAAGGADATFDLVEHLVLAARRRPS